MNSFVGYEAVGLTDAGLGLTFPLEVLYPTATPGQAERLGPYSLDVARHAPLKAGSFPLVLVSHGTGGSPWVYRTLAHYLARHGFIVGLPEHPFNNRNDNTWAGTAHNLEARPRHLSAAINYFFDAPRFAAALRPGAVGLIGHSMGGYTALALAGGQPRAFAHETESGQAQAVPVAPDHRVKALVLLAPATPWYLAENALRAVRLPILLLTAEHDEHTPGFHAELILSGVAEPGLVKHRVVKNAGHFSFLSVFPPAMSGPAFLPAQDPPGFDRTQFQAELSAEVLAFLNQVL